MNTSGHSSFTCCSLSRSLEACAWSEQQPQRGTQRFEQSLPTRDPSPFTIKRPGHWGNWQKKKKDSQRHWSTSYRRTQNDFICVCNLHLKWLRVTTYCHSIAASRQAEPFETTRRRVAHFQRFLHPPHPHFGRPGVTPRPPAQFTDQLLQTWMLLDMATFELEKFNTKKCLVQSRFYFFKKGRRGRRNNTHT